ncbi:hypothetical protein [Pseudoxanthomonas koreensis]|uniref:hypothetical protein n=1 Tax=Pseudoxanthomonas koreensis TaxID=266061 RepID=UPI00139072FE|nr:hypothetical protein [Pseudoxanthomonas koreensis]
MARSVSFNQAVHPEYASAMLGLVFEKMISDGVDATREYAREVGEWNDLKRRGWFAVAHHLRNAFSHNGRWHFERHAIVPAAWRGYRVDRELSGQPAAGFLSWFDGTQLLDCMLLYVQGVVDVGLQQVRGGGGPFL